MLRIVRKALNYGMRNGWSALTRLGMAHLRDMHNPFVKISITKEYDDLMAPPFGKTVQPDRISSKTINWFIPSVSKGSGGHLNIFRFINNLDALGYESRIIIVGRPRPATSVSAKKEIEKWFFRLNASVYVDVDEDTPPAYFAFATSWPTAYYARRFRGCIRKCYFVQDFEPWFYPAGTNAILAENTYRFGFFGFTAGGWLAGKLQTEYGMRALALGFSFDRELYGPMPEARRQDGVCRVFFYARPATERRAFELGVLVLRKVCKEIPGVRVVLAGWDIHGYDIPFPCEQAGLAGLDDLAKLYGRCDVALVLSCSNISLLPIELMACGVPVVSNRAPYTQWLLNEENSMLAEPNVEALAQAVKEIIQKPILAETLRKAGQQFAQETSWQQEANRLAAQLEKLVNDVS